MQIPENYILASDAEREYGLYAGAVRQAIFRKRIKENECIKIAGRWFVSRSAVERVYKKRT
jgi:hypothetical protein